MRWLKSISFKWIIFAYSIFFIIIISFISIILIYYLEVPIPDNISKYYFPADKLVLFDEVITISISSFQENIMSSSDIQKNFLHNFRSAMLLIVVLNVIGIGGLSTLLYYSYERKIKQPLKEITEYAFNKNTTQENETIPIHLFPKEFYNLLKTLEKIFNRIEQLYTDFNYLSTYVSHEQKNALTLLRAKIQNGNIKDIVSNIDNIVKNFNDILTICVDKNTSTVSSTDLSLVCGMVVDNYKKIYHDIHFNFDDAMPMVYGNDLWIYQAICNIVDNAIKYGKHSPIYVEVSISHGCPYVSVTDSGIGIDLDEQEKIFQKGYRIGNTKKNGYGIGLNLVKHVAMLCNAYIWVKSEKNKGTIFKIVFPPYP